VYVLRSPLVRKLLQRQSNSDQVLEGQGRRELTQSGWGRLANLEKKGGLELRVM
jgi:hypothetical protein